LIAYYIINHYDCSSFFIYFVMRILKRLFARTKDRLVMIIKATKSDVHVGQYVHL
jgi:hypothetical protein